VTVKELSLRLRDLARELPKGADTVVIIRTTAAGITGQREPRYLELDFAEAEDDDGDVILALVAKP
jgi:hypothetical protein